MVMVGPPADTELTGANRSAAALASSQEAALAVLMSLARPVGNTAEAEPGPARRRALRRLPWPLLAVLAVQAALSARLVWSNTAFQDEALYLWAGRLEISHVLHGTPIPPFATYFSGAPVVYPVVGALANGIGGLAAARLLSLCFMLAATSLLWTTASALYGRRPAFFACALWAFLGPTLHLGAFATFDAMSLCLVALATWCTVRAGERRDETGWMLASAGALALANATAYSSGIFDPAVVMTAVLTAYPVPGGKYAIMRGMSLLAYTATALILLVTVGGGYYVTGIASTVLSRAAGSDPPITVLTSSWAWTGTIMAGALAGLLACMACEHGLPRRLLLAVFAGAGLLVPLEQARIHTLTSLDKHADIGAWFAAVAAGYAAAKIIGALPARPMRAAACAVGAATLVFPVRLATAQGREFFSYPNAAMFVLAFRPMADRITGPVLAEDPSIAEYYTAAGAQWKRWSSTRSLLLPSGRDVLRVRVGDQGSPAAYARFLARGYFSLVALNFTATPDLDRLISADLTHDPRYRVVATIPYGRRNYVIWQRRGAGT
jgi:hypothetical protein